MSSIKVSVILPVYNVENYLRQCMDSVMGQTLKDIEIICVDDGSSDDSPAILEEFARKDSRIRILTQQNAGAGAARNLGMKYAKGRYLSFLDSDDFFEPDMLEKAYEKAEKYQAQIVVFRSDQYLTEQKSYNPMLWTLRMQELPPYAPFSHRQMTDNIFKVFVGWAWDKLFLRSFVEEKQLLFQEQRTSNDLLFVFSAVALAKRIAVLDNVLAHQRRDAKDSLSKTREKSWGCFYDALTALRERLCREGMYEEVERDYINYALHFSLWNLNTLAEPTRSVLKNKLLTEWFRDLGISGKEPAYFYIRSEYDQYRKLLDGETKER